MDAANAPQPDEPQANAPGKSPQGGRAFTHDCIGCFVVMFLLMSAINVLMIAINVVLTIFFGWTSMSDTKLGVVFVLVMMLIFMRPLDDAEPNPNKLPEWLGCLGTLAVIRLLFAGVSTGTAALARAFGRDGTGDPEMAFSVLASAAIVGVVKWRWTFLSRTAAPQEASPPPA